MLCFSPAFALPLFLKCFVVGFAPGLAGVGAEEGEVGVMVRQGL